MEEKELLDYCRVKKISEKGYGFLTSMHYTQNVFFHFNGIKDPAVKDKLEKQKRGALYFFYTSKPHKDRRRIYKLWLDISDVEPELIPQFVEDITREFILGKTNPFEVAYVIKQLRENDFLDKDNFHKIISSPKMIKTPSILLAMLKEKETAKKSGIEELNGEFEEKKLRKEDWVNNILSTLDNGN